MRHMVRKIQRGAHKVFFFVGAINVGLSLSLKKGWGWKKQKLRQRVSHSRWWLVFKSLRKKWAPSDGFLFFTVVLIHVNKLVSHLPFLSSLSLAAKRDSQSKAVLGSLRGIVNQKHYKGFCSHKGKGDYAPKFYSQDFKASLLPNDNSSFALSGCVVGVLKLKNIFVMILPGSKHT